MRANAIAGIAASAWGDGNCRVHVRMGFIRYTATTAEARDLARQLIEAADHVERPRPDE